jgi:hypothetical protein
MEIYGQKLSRTDGYDMIDSPIFLYWMRVLRLEGKRVTHPFVGGYKVHVSVAPADADRVARAILPKLQTRRLSHKVIFPLAAYENVNEGKQKGKFITIYAGPVLHGFADLVGELDAALVAMKATPGPRSMDRLSGYSRPEQRVGLAGMLSYITTDDYRK